MKTKSTSLLMLIFSLTLCLSSYSFANKDEKVPPVISKTNTALYNFSVNADMELSNYYKVDEKMVNDFFKMITSRMDSVNGLKLKPKKFLAGKINYDDYGYPSTRGKKAVETNKADDYLSIVVYITNTGMMGPANESNPKDCYISRKVAVKLSITVFDKAGDKVFDETATAKTDEKIQFHYSKFFIGKMEGKSYTSITDTKVLYELMQKATEEMATTIFPK
jgi:hypothetical protein